MVRKFGKTCFHTGSVNVFRGSFQPKAGNSLCARVEMPTGWTRVLFELRGKRLAGARRKVLDNVGLREHEMRRHGLGPEGSALMKNSFVDQHERDRLGIRLPIRAHEDAELVEDLDEEPRARAMHADDDYRACLSQPWVHAARAPVKDHPKRERQSRKLVERVLRVIGGMKVLGRKDQQAPRHHVDRSDAFPPLIGPAAGQ